MSKCCNKCGVWGGLTGYLLACALPTCPCHQAPDKECNCINEYFDKHKENCPVTLEFKEADKENNWRANLRLLLDKNIAVDGGAVGTKYYWEIEEFIENLLIKQEELIKSKYASRTKN